jgi:predicted Zn-dependent protease
MKPKLGAIWAACILGFLAGCYTVPETGRQALILPLFDDVQMGAQAFAEIRAKEKVSTDPALNARIQKIGQRIAEAVGDRMPNAQWEFVVFDGPDTVNAFALPGGKVGVYTGLIKLAASDDELAFVMGHEIAHVTSRHSAQRASTMALAAAGGVALDVLARDDKKHDLMLAAYGLIAAGGTLAYSRSHESEADYVGLRFLAYAGYDPHAAVSFWQKMAAQEKGGARMPELLSTHPSDDRRIEALQAQIPEVMPIYEANRKRTP